ncbi:unnamed protein product [Caenorhabditis auriculariae]|uniref:Uncharacterized protein n=1 Tax=Caenorhabditis auriculariae TaxID=2777116 RepID=A0A8S1HW35_9PELO|nr:unnamed protein product [Caenorhabditis auriculariae]
MSFQMTRFLVLAAIFGTAAAVLDQSVAVKGTLMCGDDPAANVRVKLWEEDGGPDPDDLLDQGYTKDDGSFELSGGTAELTPIDPVFKVYHDCDDGVKPGARKVVIYVPKSYITKGTDAKKTFNIGTINLETTFGAEGRELVLSRHRREPDNYNFLDNLFAGVDF